MLRSLTLAAVVAAALALAGPAGAVVFGAPDGEGHPNVGALLAPQAYPDGTWASCSGTLISPTVFLTAAHCDWDVERITAVRCPTTTRPRTRSTGAPGTPTPGFGQRQFDPRDIAVVVFDEPVIGITPAALPEVGLARQASSRDEAHVRRLRRPGRDERPGREDVPLRRCSVCRRRLAELCHEELAPHLREPGQGRRRHATATPVAWNFLGGGSGETNIVAATTITGDAVCRATNVTYRLDTASACNPQTTT